ncbi:response regulator (plasmid) [Phenylobacterium sp. LH3H17]|uniref:response regulator n=1 Tax=Phenylobacterium sp. LH3H17 TaxID=2903901 RepID=UPI0020C9571E|nr:response regulator [Phenylobacterium sp. LH3H17]UTP41734.1 response regulator [Phenylobacterium sp. LH3H17]
MEPRPTALVVDENALVRGTLADCLEDAGFVVIQAKDGVSAVLVLESGAAFHVLFTGIQMPGPIDGLGVANRVYARRPGTPIVVTSGRGVPDALPPGGHFISKPYDVAAIVTLLSELVAA